MGGLRCSYHNCKVKSDGKTHMFHYPVFDKVRCHQWLVNSGRLDFLNLKLSQLKNRVVCQHHFRTDNFMNFKKDKLKFDAVPTLDGPYSDCNTEYNFQCDKSNDYSIMLDDIENEYMTLNDKKANYPVKYADFLGNNDLISLDMPKYSNQLQIKDVYHTVNNLEDQHKIKIEINKTEFPRINDTLIDLEANTTEYNNIHSTAEHKHLDDPYKNNTTRNTYQLKSPHPNTSKKSQSPPVLVVPPYSNNKSEDNQLSIEIELPPNFDVNLLHSNNNIDGSTVNMWPQNQPSWPLPPPAPTTPLQSSKLKKPRIKILSEKKISKPMTVTGKLEPISTSSILPRPHHNARDKETVNLTNVNKQCLYDPVQSQMPITSTESVMPMMSTESIISMPPTESAIPITPSESVIPMASTESIIPMAPTKSVNTIEPTESVISVPSTESLAPLKCNKMSNKKEYKSQINKPPQETSPKISYLKNKITPERIAAIESKRKFNMKLRDIIESFLVNIDDRDKIDGEVKKTEKKPLEKRDLTQKVGPHLSKEQEMPSLHDYTIAYLDARMKKMEDTLARKIDQNSQRIVDLQKSIEHNIQKRKTTGTQTSTSQESEKRQLYQEISQYLSPDANSLIYEELFINKYVQGMTNSASHLPKRKRPR